MSSSFLAVSLHAVAKRVLSDLEGESYRGRGQASDGGFGP